MSTGDALYQAVVTSPDDGLPRLVYADWLDERNDPQGEFIRVQVEMAKLPERDDRYRALYARSRQLLAESKGAFAPVELRDLHPKFRRGAVNEIIIEADQLIEDPEILTRHPIDKLTVTYVCEENLDALAKLEQLRRIKDLTVVVGQSTQPHLKPLTEEADYETQEFGVSFLRRLLAPGKLSQLEGLQLYVTLEHEINISQENVQALGTLPQLKRFGLRHSGALVFDAHTFDAFTSLPNVQAKLEALHVPGVLIPTGTHDIPPHITHLHRLSQLKDLDVSGNYLSNVRLLALMESPTFSAQLEKLDISDNIDPNAPEPLNLAPLLSHCRNLRSLSAGANRVSDEGLSALCALPNLQATLQRLNIVMGSAHESDADRITHQGFAQLRRLPHLEAHHIERNVRDRKYGPLEEIDQRFPLTQGR